MSKVNLMFTLTTMALFFSFLSYGCKQSASSQSDTEGTGLSVGAFKDPYASRRLQNTQVLAAGGGAVPAYQGNSGAQVVAKGALHMHSHATNSTGPELSPTDYMKTLKNSVILGSQTAKKESTLFPAFMDVVRFIPPKHRWCISISKEPLLIEWEARPYETSDLFKARVFALRDLADNLGNLDASSRVAARQVIRNSIFILLEAGREWNSKKFQPLKHIDFNLMLRASDLLYHRNLDLTPHRADSNQ